MAEKIVETRESGNNAATGAMMVILFICALLAIGVIAYQNDVFELPSAEPTQINIEVPAPTGNGGN